MTNASTPTTSPTLWRHTPTSDAARCAIELDPAHAAREPVHAFLYGKFCEHLGHNIYQGMEAQILHNPTFGKWRFFVGEDEIDGGAAGEYDRAKALELARRYLMDRFAVAPQAVLDAYVDGAAFPWLRVGGKDDVALSPDVGPHGGRAQRIETTADGCGIAVPTWLPLHRTRRYRFRIVARAVRPVVATLALAQSGDGIAAGAPLASATVALADEWRAIDGTLAIAAGAAIAADALHRFALTAPAEANLVVARILLYPDDAVGTADPEIIRLSRDARLPLLRWPGGNFVSGYRWRDGVGPADARPTLPNPAWMGLEYNLFGTAEFVAWCRAVGCEPMICVNAGDGTPEEAAAWVEYCNGDATTPMGRLRAEHGHREPFAIRWWEIGNELWGRWQVSWTTPGGKADRYRRFADAMRRADPSIALLGCGCHWWPDGAWDRLMLKEAGGTLRSLTDHILTGGWVDRTVPAVEIFHAFMTQSETLAARYREIAAAMRAAGVDQPRLAITELQQFARLRAPTPPDAPAVPGGVDRTTLPNRLAMSEALYATAIIHTAIRSDGFVELITHSATVNHGGGIRKARERSFGDPVHWAHQLGAELIGGVPIAVAWSSPTFASTRAFERMPPVAGVPSVDVVAVRHGDGRLVAVIMHRDADCGPLSVRLTVRGNTAPAASELSLLAAPSWHAENTRLEPERIVPRPASIESSPGAIEFTLPPFAIARLTLRADRGRP